MTEHDDNVKQELEKSLGKVTASRETEWKRVKNPKRVATGKRLAQRNKDAKELMKEDGASESTSKYAWLPSGVSIEMMGYVGLVGFPLGGGGG